MKNKLKTIKLFEDFLKKEEELKLKSFVNKRKSNTKRPDEESGPVEEPLPEPQDELDQEEENLLSEIKKYYKRKGW
jgi:hypothetical protein